MWRIISLQSGLRATTVLSVRLLVHPSWVLFWAIVGWLVATEVASAAYPEHDAPARWLQALLANALIFASAALHEAAHLAVGLRLRLPIRRVVLFPFGGVRTGSSQAISWRDEFLLAGAGPLTSLAAGLILLGAAPAGAQPLATWVGLFNVTLAALNLAPIEPLDGAAILQALGRKRGTSAFKLTRFSFRAGDLVADGLVWLGLPAVIIAGRVEGLLLVLLGCMLQIANNVFRVQENPQQKEILHRTPVAEVVGKPPPLARSASAPARPAAPGTGPRNKPAALPGDGAALPSTLRPPLEPWRIPANAMLGEALERLDRPEAPGKLFIVDKHRIIGVCSQSDLLNYLFSHREDVQSRG